MAGTLLATLSACSGASDANDSVRPRSERIKTAGQLHSLCEKIKKGHPKAAKYAGDGPHSTVVFANSYRHDKDAASGYALLDEVAFNGVAPVFSETSVSDVALLGCVEGKRGDSPTRSCTYSGLTGISQPSRTLPLYDQEFEYTVYALRTGRVVETYSRSPSSGSCPKSVRFGDEGEQNNPTMVYEQLPDGSVDLVLEEVVTGPARPSDG
ncbi:hypothetical protein AN216_21030 [Streptomyces oceani]|uniref:Lipoprotein n=2 Tax=Streptomyces oceani TaxID=1075402 RepID=A0A1E7JXE1_9ACTN|nr:hypothetical protein AN216_21030 [Streptomyces oceani]